MNWLKGFNNALEHIEDHILDDIDIDKIAKIALCSKFHFLRTFNILAGFPLGEYIRNRRLSLAAKDLVSTDEKVINLAYRYKYETPESFSKAFKKFHGISPSRARKEQALLKTVLPLSFQITIRGEERMDYRIERKSGFKVVGLSKRVSMKNNESYTTIPQFLQEVTSNGSYDIMVKDKQCSMGVGYDFDLDREFFTYFIGVKGDYIEGLENQVVLNIPESTWAIFKSVGPMPHSIQKVWHRIYAEWFPATKYEHANTPEIEMYYAGDPYVDDYICEVWIPIVEK